VIRQLYWTHPIIDLLNSRSQYDVRRLPLAIPAHGLRFDRLTVQLMDHESVNLLVFKMGYEGVSEAMEGPAITDPTPLLVSLEPLTDCLPVSMSISVDNCPLC
jgi:hypothetical protein